MLLIEEKLEILYDDTFDIVVEDLMSHPDYADIEESNGWLKGVLEYNVPHGKKFRGLALVKTFCEYSKDYSPEDLRRACILGWSVEMLHSSFLIADDIMDGSTMRRDQPCWYRLGNIGNNAVNDAYLLASAAAVLGEMHFKKEKYHKQISSEFLRATYMATMGQCLDTLTPTRLHDDDFRKMTMQRYKLVCKYKTTYYSFCLPILLGLTMCNVTDAEFLDQVKEILEEIGYLFQAQDDILDCYGDQMIIGKNGTDIATGKCSWVLVRSLQLCSDEQRKTLQECYGGGSEDLVKIARVKKVFDDLDIYNDFKRHEKDVADKIRGRIDQLPGAGNFTSGKLFHELLEAFLNREK